MPFRAAQIIGTILSAIVARAPWAWPLVRGFTRRFWDKRANGWSAQASPDRAAALEAGARELPREPGRVLEIGSGTGDGTVVLRAAFPDAEIVGADLSPAMVEIASAKVPSATFHVADAASLPFPDASVDLVAQLNVPFYAREVKRVLKPDGHVLVASTLGPSTPYYTPHGDLRKRFHEVASGQAGRGDWFIGTPSA